MTSPEQPGSERPRRFRKKPVVIHAFQYGHETAPDWALNAIRDGKISSCREAGYAEIFTLEGTMTARKGDWIVLGIKNELYPVKPDIFEATFEEVE